MKNSVILSQKIKSMLVLTMTFCALFVNAQSKLDPSVIALNFVKNNATKWGLTPQDIPNIKVQYSYKTEHNGVQHVYLVQELNGIELFNVVGNVSILPSGEVLYSGQNFLSNPKSYVSSPSISAADAVLSAAKHLNINALGKMNLVSQSANQHEFEFLPNGIAAQNIKVKLKYYPDETTGKIHLAWNPEIDLESGEDYWSLFVDAQSGEILHKHSYVLKCQFHDHAFANLDADCRDLTTQNTPSVKTEKISEKPMGAAAAETYRVFKLPAESPQTGAHQLVVNPADAVASPFGWHDTDGAAGAEFTYTRGNNAHTFLDWFATGRSVLQEPNGGAGLNFDFPYTPNASHDEVANAAMVNLFYMNNMLHDITHRYGFDEPAGNFQTKNYTGQGLGLDQVSARAQAGGKAINPTLNNATFGTPVDGQSGTMRMFLWTRSVLGATGVLRNLHISAPASIAGDYQTGLATFSPVITTASLAGDMVLYADTTIFPTRGCERSVRSMAGKIALIDLTTTFSSTCSPARKVLNAQDSGAVAVVLCGATTLSQVLTDTFLNLVSRIRIPVVNISLTDATTIKNALAANTVSGSIYRMAKDTVGPDLIDGDFENGIIAHEFGHGLSNRLTGGPQNVSCLGGGEQMGEGWSDFLALMLTQKPGDRGEMRRAMGPFVLRQPSTGLGIRRYNYSTDMTINPQSYDSIYTSQVSPHPIGELWCSTLWDLNWKMIEKYGYDANWLNFNSGNSKTMKLVLDGMKMQPCQPSFVTGRDAILAADRANFNGENQCLIWDVFARRGLGYKTIGGRGNSANDNMESRERTPICVKELKINKLVTENIQAGDTITVTLRITNHKDQTVTNVNVSDDIPTGATFILASASRTPTLAGATVSFRLDSVRSGDSATITFKMATLTTKRSVNISYDDFELPRNIYTAGSVSGTARFITIDTVAKSGVTSFVAAASTSSDQTLTLTNAYTVQGRQPVLRFFHNYITDSGNDAGAVEISENNGATWVSLHPKMFRNAAGGLTYLSYPITTKTYWGNSGGFVASYVDLKDYVGKSIKFRFRFKTNASIRGSWAIDDVGLFDMENYESAVKITSAQGDNVTVQVGGRGTIVEPNYVVSTKELGDTKVSISPNPTNDILNVSVNAKADEVTLILTTIDGRQISRQTVLGQSATPLSMSALAAGMYFLTVESNGQRLVQKVVKQ